jgi:hypothetical protein
MKIFKNSCFHHHIRETHVQYWVIIENYFIYVIIIFKKLIVWCYVVYIFANDFWTFYIRRRRRVCVFRMRRTRNSYNKSLKYLLRVIDAFLLSRTDEKNNFSRFRENFQKHDNQRQQDITLLQNSIRLEILYTKDWSSSKYLNQIDAKSFFFFFFDLNSFFSKSRTSRNKQHEISLQRIRIKEFDDWKLNVELNWKSKIIENVSIWSKNLHVEI